MKITEILGMAMLGKEVFLHISIEEKEFFLGGKYHKTEPYDWEEIWNHYKIKLHRDSWRIKNIKVYDAGNYTKLNNPRKEKEIQELIKRDKLRLITGRGSE